MRTLPGLNPTENGLSSPLPTEKLPNKAHTGLWYDKYCDKWLDVASPSSWENFNDPDNRKWKGLGDEGKKKWIDTVTQKPCGDSTTISDFALRQRNLVAARSGDIRVFKTDGRFVTGMGRTHPVENGFAWHPTLGTPYLPGSSVKGMVRAYVDPENGWCEEEDKPAKDEFYRIFGPRDKTGTVIFLDALPTKAIQLEADVMTPHYGPYYSGASGQTAPGDWHSPNPIPFLAVAHDQPFQFAILPTRNAKEKDVETVFEWLEAALTVIGAGAKTAVGYGRFRNAPEEKPPEPPESPTAKLVREIKANPQDLPGRRENLMSQIESLPSEERAECAKALKDAYPPKAWKKAAEKTWRKQLESWLNET